ncbi:zinc transporter ZIP9-like [Babylonia areolata]|uniref:zinc transporter ZIP9-like n=1 Tax=Babylonia areolata TaxID=304850 RepID=UPI003FD44AEF
MDDIWTLISLSLAMLVGCYLAGAIPLTFKLSEEKLKLITVLGAGLLVGTALAVIIPEGVHAMYSSGGHDEELQDEAPLNVAIRSDDQIADTQRMAEMVHDHHHSKHHDMEVEHSVIGVSLVAGFIFMLIVDQMGGSMHSHSSPGDAEFASMSGTSGKNKMTATVGLVVHAAADGVAMGAAITMSETHITTIVFLAIMLHKAPAAFGLVSFLLHENLERSRIRTHLLVFSLAAPVLTVVTYFGLSQTSTESLSDMHMTGIAMLFSAGTFLYVATVHVLPEIATVQHRHTMGDGTVVIRETKGFKNVELMALVIGAVVPVLLSVGHKH